MNNLKDLQQSILTCSKCSLSKLRDQGGYENPVPGCGSINARIMIIGEAPGADEVKKGQPFVGRAGQLLKEVVKEAGAKPHHVYRANVIHCRPYKNKFTTISKQDIHTCSYWWKKQVHLVKPEVIIGCGNQPLKYIANSSSTTTQCSGIERKIEEDVFGYAVYYVPVLHPSFCLRPGSPNSNNEIIRMSQDEKRQELLRGILNAIELANDLVNSKCRYKKINGDILETNNVFIAHQTNCKSDNAMGLAHYVFKKFPQASYSNNPNRNPGTIDVFGGVINMNAQVYPGAPKYPGDTSEDRVRYFQQCLDAIREDSRIDSVAFPFQIGCGLARGDWAIYERMINEFAYDYHGVVQLYKI